MNLTRLDAVNRILRGAKEHPVSSLGDPTQNDTVMAEQILDELVIREQMTGLHVNTVNTSFTPDANNFVILPNNTLQVRGANQHVCRNYFHREDAGVVYLFDADKTPATKVFADDAAVYVELSQSLDFEDIPVQHQFSIADQAAVEYQRAVLNSDTVDRQLVATAGRSRAIARAYDMRSRPHNQFTDGQSQGPRIGSRYVPRSWPFNDNIAQ